MAGCGRKVYTNQVLTNFQTFESIHFVYLNLLYRKDI